MTLEEVAVAGTLPLLGAWLVLMPWMAAQHTHHVRPSLSDVCMTRHSPWPARCQPDEKGTPAGSCCQAAWQISAIVHVKDS